MKSKNIFLVGITLLALTNGGCASWFGWGKPEPDPELIRQRKARQETDFKKAIALYDAQKYEAAEKSFQSYLNKHPGSDFELMAHYNLGSIAEATNRCDLASEKYRHVVKTSGGKFQSLEAMSLLRLSYVYECLKQDTKTIATLKDLESRKSFLPDEAALAEWPARLAAAYARIGNRKLAEKYFRQAEEGLKTINGRVREPEKKKDLLAKTLFFMGSMEKQKLDLENNSSFIDSLKFLQAYLLKSVELEASPWSMKAAEQIVRSYDLIFNRIQTSVDVKAELRKDLAVNAVASLTALRGNRFPDTNEPKIVRDLFLRVDAKEKQFRSFLAKLQESNELTAEGQERTGVKQKGVIRSDDAELQSTKVKKLK